MTFWIICGAALLTYGGAICAALAYLEKKSAVPATPVPAATYGDTESDALAVLRETTDKELFLGTALEWDLGSKERAEVIADRLRDFSWDLADEDRLDELFLDAPEGRLKNALARELAIIIVARARTGSYEKLLSAFLVRGEELVILLHAGAKLEQYYRNEKRLHVVQARLQESFIGQMGPREYLSIARYLNIAA